MLKMAAALFMILAASTVYLHAAQPGGLCALIGHPYVCPADAPYRMNPTGLAAAD